MIGTVEGLVAPMAPEFCLLGHFILSDSVSLVVIKSDLFELYEITKDSTLTLRHQTRLSFAPKQVIRLPNFLKNNSRTDGLLLAWDTGNGAMYSTMVYDGLTDELSTTSMHHYANEEYRTEWLADCSEVPVNSVLAADPLGRCMVMRVYREHMAVVPLELMETSGDGGLGGGLDTGSDKLLDTGMDNPKEERLPSWIVKLKDADPQLSNAVCLDWCFLSGYSEPTLALLLQQGPGSWTGRAVPIKKDSRCFAILNVNCRLQSLSLIHFQSNLPNDLDRLASAGDLNGCFALGTSSIVYLEQGNYSPTGLAVNMFAYKLSDFRYLPNPNQLEITVNDGQLVSIGQNTFWLLLCGKRFILKAMKANSRFVNSLTIQPCEGKQDTVTISDRLGDYIVFGEESGNVNLYSCRDTSTHQAVTRQNPQEVLDENELYLAEMELEETRSRVDSSANVRLVDTLVDGGQLVHSTLAFHSFTNADRPVTVKTPKVIVGVNTSGSVCVMAPSIPVKEYARFPVPNALACFAVSGKYWLVSTMSTTLVLETKQNQQLREVEESGFYLEGRTIAAASHLGTIVQVYERGIRLLQNVELMTEVLFDQGAYCVQASVHDGTMVCTVDSLKRDTVFTVSPNGLTIVNQGSDALFNGFFSLNQVNYYYRYTQSDGRLTIINDGNVIFANNIVGFLPRIVKNEHVDIQDRPLAHPEQLMICDFLGTVYLIVAAEGLLAVYRLNSHQSVYYFSKTSAVQPLANVKSLRQVRLSASLHGVAVQTSSSRMHMIVFGKRGYPRIHRFLGSINFCSELNPEEGKVLLVDRAGRVRLSQILTTKYDLDRSDCAVYKLHIHSAILEGTQQQDNVQRNLNHKDIESKFIVYLPHVNTFAIVFRRKTAFHLPNDDYHQDADCPDFEYPKSNVEPSGHVYYLGLLSPISWTVTDTVCLNDPQSIPGTDEYTIVVDCKVCSLTTKSVKEGRKPYIVVGVVGQKGEDRPVRGRCLVFDVNEVVPQVNRPETNRKLRLMTSADVKTTIACIQELRGAVLVSQGTRIILHAFENDDSLQGCAFVDSLLYSSQASSLGGLFALGDAQRGVSLYGYQEEPPRMAQLARSMDYNLLSRQSITSIQLVPHADDDVLIVSADQNGNLMAHQYAPRNPRSLGGSKLLLAAGCRLSTVIVCMHRLGDLLILQGMDGSISALRFFASADPDAFTVSQYQQRAMAMFPQPGRVQWAHKLVIPSYNNLDEPITTKPIVPLSSSIPHILTNCSLAQLNAIGQQGSGEWASVRGWLERRANDNTF